VHGLFQRRLDGDDALLELARLRFSQAGLAAELYADTPDQLGHLLGFVDRHPCLPVVHLNRGVNLLYERDRRLVEDFVRRFRGRLSGLVAHDQREMAARVPELVAAVHQLDARLGREPAPPRLFLEYAAGLDLGTFVEIGRRLRDVERFGLCVDVGHVGIGEARRAFAQRHPDLDLATLEPKDARLPGLVADVQSAVASALPSVLQLTRALALIGTPAHFHLHDGHPIIRGLSDHFSFLTQVAVPFDYLGRRSLDTMYGPGGLAAIVQAAMEGFGPERVSLTLEIHQTEGRVPLGDAGPLFRHWKDLANAERMNYWLTVLAENGMLLSSSLRSWRAAAGGGPGET
jgi:hypothetical protein